MNSKESITWAAAEAPGCFHRGPWRARRAYPTGTEVKDEGGPGSGGLEEKSRCGLLQFLLLLALACWPPGVASFWAADNSGGFPAVEEVVSRPPASERERQLSCAAEFLSWGLVKTSEVLGLILSRKLPLGCLDTEQRGGVSGVGNGMGKGAAVGVVCRRGTIEGTERSEWEVMQGGVVCNARTPHSLPTSFRH